MQAAPVPRRGVTAGVEPHVKETGAAGRGLALLGCQRARSAPRGACLGLLGPAGTRASPVWAPCGVGGNGAPRLCPPPAFLRRVAFCLLAASRLGHRRPLFRFPQNPTGDFRRDLRARCATARAGPSRSSGMVFWGRRVLARARSRQAAVRCRFGAGGLSGQPRTGWAESRPRGCRRLRTGWAERAPGCGRGPRGPCTGGRRPRRTGSPAPGGEKSRLWLLGRPPGLQLHSGAAARAAVSPPPGLAKDTVGMHAASGDTCLPLTVNATLGSVSRAGGPRGGLGLFLLRGRVIAWGGI